jgi:hypothetical protein
MSLQLNAAGMRAGGWEVANSMSWAIVAIIGSPLIILIPVAIAHNRRERLLRTLGTSSAGRILELGRSDDGLGGGGPWAKVEYQRDGYLYRSTVPVRHSLRDYKVGQRVSLTYVPGRSIVRLDS